MRTMGPVRCCWLWQRCYRCVHANDMTWYNMFMFMWYRHSQFQQHEQRQPNEGKSFQMPFVFIYVATMAMALPVSHGVRTCESVAIKRHQINAPEKFNVNILMSTDNEFHYIPHSKSVPRNSLFSVMQWIRQPNNTLPHIDLNLLNACEHAQMTSNEMTLDCI